MRLTYPILSAVGASALVALVARLFGSSIPGEGMASLGNLILLLGAGFILLPPLAFGVVGSRVGLRRLALATVIMGVLQVVLLAVVVMTLAGMPVSDFPLLWILVMIVGVPTVSGGIALALTGNLTSPTADDTPLK